MQTDRKLMTHEPLQVEPQAEENAALHACFDDKIEKECAPRLASLTGARLHDQMPDGFRLTSLLTRASQIAPEKGIRFLLNVEGEQDFFSYADFEKRVRQVAAVLGKSVPSPSATDKSSSCVLIVTRDMRRTLLAFWACLFSGAIPVVCAFAGDVRAREWRNLASVIGTLGEPVVLTSEADFSILETLLASIGCAGRLMSIDRLRTLDNAPSGPAPGTGSPAADDPAFFLMTSGSSGKPKLVMQTHRTVRSHLAAVAQHYGFGHEDAILNWLPLDHVGALVFLHLQSVWLACDQVQASMIAVLARPVLWLEWMNRYRVTLTWAPNFAFSLCNQSAEEFEGKKWDLSCIRAMVNGGECIVQTEAITFIKTLEKYHLRSGVLQPAWGMSETCSGAIFSTTFGQGESSPSRRYVNVGVPVPGFSLRVVGERGETVPWGQAGELEVRGAQVTPGYYRNEIANSESFTQDGWFRTGDTALVEDGEVAIVGRSKQVIIINGTNYSASEIESVVAQVPGVRHTCVAAVAIRGSAAVTDRIGIALATDGRRAEDEIRTGVGRAVMSTFHCAKPLVAVIREEEMPRTSLGKVLYGEVEKMLGSSATLIAK